MKLELEISLTAVRTPNIPEWLSPAQPESCCLVQVPLSDFRASINEWE